jgi:hypothetical protein
MAAYAIGFIYSSNDTQIEKTVINSIANGPTYQFRAIVGDFLIVQICNKIHKKSNNIETTSDLIFPDKKTIFWNPIWDFNKMDIITINNLLKTLNNSNYEKLNQQDINPNFIISILRSKLISHIPAVEDNFCILKNFYILSSNLDEISKYIALHKDSVEMLSLFELLFMHPHWKVAEEAAAVLATLYQSDAHFIDIYNHLFINNNWRINYGVAEAAFLARSYDKNFLFYRAVDTFYNSPHPLLRGNCVENLVALLLSSSSEERYFIFSKYTDILKYWLNDSDCWVLDHLHRLYNNLYVNETMDPLIQDILDSNNNKLFNIDNNTSWYHLSRDEFLLHIEKIKSCCNA